MEVAQKTVVLVEDNDVLAKLIEAKLVHQGYATKIARDGIEGLALIRSTKPDLVLLDMGLPRLDGFGVLEALHAEHILPKLPVIIISNTGQNIEVERAKNLGARDYLIKVNFNPDDLMAKIEELFKGGGGSQRPSMSRAESGAVLIVDDEPFFIELLEQKFKREGFGVRHGADADEAREELKKGGVAIVLLDVRLPGTDGLTFLQEMRTHPEWKSIPVIMTSNLSEADFRDQATKAGANGYLIKAHQDPSDIVSAVKEMLGRSPS